jgi:hypothetical protein
MRRPTSTTSARPRLGRRSHRPAVEPFLLDEAAARPPDLGADRPVRQSRQGRDAKDGSWEGDRLKSVPFTISHTAERRARRIAQRAAPGCGGGWLRRPQAVAGEVRA